MRTVLKIVFLLAFVLRINAQGDIIISKRIDSLLLIVKKHEKEDSIKVKYYNNIGASYLELNQFDKAIEIIEKGIAISQKLNYKRGLSVAYHNLGLVYDYLSDYVKSVSYYKLAL